MTPGPEDEDDLAPIPLGQSPAEDERALAALPDEIEYLRATLADLGPLADRWADWLPAQAAAGRIIITAGTFTDRPTAAAAAAADAFRRSCAIATLLSEALREVRVATDEMVVADAPADVREARQMLRPPPAAGTP